MKETSRIAYPHIWVRAAIISQIRGWHIQIIKCLNLLTDFLLSVLVCLAGVKSGEVSLPKGMSTSPVLFACKRSGVF